MNTPNPSRWPELFRMAVSIIDQANSNGLEMNDWSFGGGTALMLQIDHRDSHDVDMFVTDPQYLPYLNPETQNFDLEIAPSTYEQDGSQSLKIVYDGIGEIDFICSNHVTDDPFQVVQIEGRDVRRETPAEIIGKKIIFRGTRIQPRDMFDIAAASIVLGEDALVKSLEPFSSECAASLEVARRMKPELAQAAMQKLLARKRFAELHSNAQEIATGILERVARTGTP